MSFNLITGFGISTSSFTNNQDDITGQWVLQGSNSFALIYILNSDISLDAYDKLGTGGIFLSPLTGKVISDKAVQYVDDTSQFLNPAGISQHMDLPMEEAYELLPQIASTNSQIWADLQWISGGQLNLDKCFHNTFQNNLNYKTMYHITLSKPISIKHQEGKQKTDLAHISSTDGRQTLGAIISPDGDGKAQLCSCLNRAREVRGKLNNAGLSQIVQWLSMTMVIEPAITYPFVTCFFSPTQLQPIDTNYTQLKCSALGLNRNFPRTVLHGPPELGGLGIILSKQKITRERINYFLYNIWCDYTIREKLNISIIYTQMEVGLLSQFLSKSFYKFGHLATTV